MGCPSLSSLLALLSAGGKNALKSPLTFLRGVLLHVWYAEENKSLEGCLQLLTNPRVDIAKTLETMRTAAHDPTGTQWTDTAGHPTTTHPVVAAAARAVENQAPNERTSTVSTAVAFFNLYQDAIIAANTKESDFSVRHLIDPALPPVRVYITIPTPEMGRLKPFVRILFYLIFHHLTAELRDPSRGWAERGAHGRRVLLLMDEFPLLGHMRLFHNTISVMAGYGIKVVLAQDLTQIIGRMARRNITGNCRIRCVAPNRKDAPGCRQRRMRTDTNGSAPHRESLCVVFAAIASEQEVKRGS